jgi:hypothetical protein
MMRGFCHHATHDFCGTEWVSPSSELQARFA